MVRTLPTETMGDISDKLERTYAARAAVRGSSGAQLEEKGAFHSGRASSADLDAGARA
jgi:hypothetical protein